MWSQSSPKKNMGFVVRTWSNRDPPQKHQIIVKQIVDIMSFVQSVKNFVLFIISFLSALNIVPQFCLVCGADDHVSVLSKYQWMS